MTENTNPRLQSAMPTTGENPQAEVVQRKVSTTSQSLAKASRGIWMLTMATQFLLLFRFLLRLLEANPANPFARMVFNLSDAVMVPFRNLVQNPEYAGIVLDAEAIIAALAYLMFSWLLVESLWVLFYGQRRKVVIEKQRTS